MGPKIGFTSMDYVKILDKLHEIEKKYMLVYFKTCPNKPTLTSDWVTPLLTLWVNSAGVDDYVCTNCGAVFQRPNPLKSHIRRHCAVPLLPTSFAPAAASSDSSSRIPPPLLSRPPWWSAVLAGFPTSVSLASSPMQFLPEVHSSADQRAVSDNVTGTSAWCMLDYLQQVLRQQADKLTSDSSASASGVKQASSQLATSSRTDGGAGRYACPYCGRLYSRRYGLKIHIRTHTGFKPLQCTVCGRPFADPSNLNKHIRLHSQSSIDDGSLASPYRCCHCGKVLVRRRDLDRHVHARHPDQLPHDVSRVEAHAIVVTSSEPGYRDDDDVDNFGDCRL